MPDTQKIIRFRTLVHRLKIDEDTMRDMIYNTSHHRAKSTKELSNTEIDDLIRQLNDLVGGMATREWEEKNQLRRKIISLMKTIGITDIRDIKDMVKEHWKKDFNQYNRDEYRKIIGVIERQWVPFYLIKLTHDKISV